MDAFQLFYLIAFLGFIGAAALIGWLVVLAGTALLAATSGKSIRLAIQPLLDEL